MEVQNRHLAKSRQFGFSQLAFLSDTAEVADKLGLFGHEQAIENEAAFLVAVIQLPAPNETETGWTLKDRKPLNGQEAPVSS